MATATKPKAKGKMLPIVLTVIGVILIILSIVWQTTIWPNMTLMPKNLDTWVYQEGYFDVLSQETGQFIHLPVLDPIHVTSNKTVDGTVFVIMTHSITNPEGVVYTQWPRVQILAVDRKTGRINPALHQYPVGDSGATYGGYMKLPSGLGEGSTFSMFHPGSATIRPFVYLRDEVFTYTYPDGKVKNIDTVVFRQNIVEVPVQLPGGMGPGIMNGYLDLWIEPDSGTIIDDYSDEYIDVEIPGMGRMTVFKTLIYYSDEQIEDMIDQAHKMNTMMPLMGTTLPWVVFAIGALLVLVGIYLYMMKGKQKQA